MWKSNIKEEEKLYGKGLLINRQPMNKDNLIKKLLLFEWENVEEIFKYRKVLYRLWKTREMKLKRNQ